MSAQTYAWRGIDDAHRVDRAHLVFDDDGLHAIGTTIAPTFGSVWQLEVDRGWVTRELCVTRSDQVYGSSMPGQVSHTSPGGNFMLI
jgi:hypothetical protein